MPGNNQKAFGTFDALKQALGSPDQRWTPETTLGFPAAIEELHGQLRDPRIFDEKHHSAAIKSAIEDFRYSTKHELPDKVARALEPHLNHTAGALELVDNDPSDTTHKASAAKSLEDLRTRLIQPSVLIAAWQDLTKQLGKENATCERVAVSRDLFIDLMFRAGHDHSRIDLLLDILDDYIFFTLDAHTSLKRFIGEDWYTKEDIDPSPADRLKLCHKIISLPPQKAWHVIWLGYGDARLYKSNYATLGNICFFNAQTVPDDQERVVAKYGDLVPNWTERDTRIMSRLPKKSNTVIARVYLEEGIYVDPLAEARRQIEALIALGAFDANVPRQNFWRPLQWSIHYSSTGSRRETNNPGPTPSTTSRFGALIHDEMTQARQVVKGQSTPDTNRLREAIDLLHWWQAAQTQSSLARVTANVRVIETIATRVGTTSWDGHLTNFFLAAWLLYNIRGNFIRTILEAVGGSRVESLPIDSLKKWNIVKENTLVFDDLMRVDLVPGATRTAFPQLLDVYPALHITGRRLRTLSRRVSSRDAMRRWKQGLTGLWHILISRLHRTRNAVIHGGPVTDAAADSIADFSDLLASWEVRLALRSALSGTDITEEYADFRRRREEELASLMSTPNPDDVLHETALDLGWF